MIALPEELLVHERRLGDGGGVLPIPPLRPVLPKVDTVPQLLGTESAVSEDEIVTALGERGLVVVGIWEDDGVVLLSLSEEEMIGGLIASLSQNRYWISRNYKTTYPCSNSTLVLWILDRDRQDAICEILDRRLPIPLRDRCSEDSCWLDVPVRDRQTHDRARFHRRSGAFSRRGEIKRDRLGNTIAIHEVREFDLDVDAVGVLIVISHFNSGIMSRSKFGEGGDWRDPLVGGDESLEIVGL